MNIRHCDSLFPVMTSSHEGQGQGAMIGLQTRFPTCFVLALSVLLLGTIIGDVAAQEPGAQAKPGQGQAADESGAENKAKEAQPKGNGGAQGQKLDPAVVSA